MASFTMKNNIKSQSNEQNIFLLNPNFNPGISAC